MKLNKLGRWTKRIAFTAGAVLLFGTTGALELGDIMVSQALIQYGLGVICCIVGTYMVSLEK